MLIILDSETVQDYIWSTMAASNIGVRYKRFATKDFYY